MRLAAALPNMAGGSLAGIVATAAAAEDLGWESVWVADHILVDNASASQYGHAFEALETLAFVAGRFRRVGIGTAVLVVPMRDPVVLARQLATLDLLSEGRLTVGVGVGWGAGEFRNLGAWASPLVLASIVKDAERRGERINSDALLEAVADYASIALINARLFRSLEARLAGDGMPSS